MRALWASAAAVVLAATLGAAEFPQTEISNGVIKAKFYLPDAEKGYYQATRFDWSGVISSLEWNHHNYFGVWFSKYDPKLHDAITGPVEEFRTGMSGLGYDEAKVGGTFIRIGVGVLRKPDDGPFQQFKTYDIVDSGKRTVHTAKDSIEFTQELADPSSGYAYLYRKTVRLVPGKPQMVIEHTIKNTGKKAIETNVYNHNFFVMDEQPTGPDFTVRFGFKPVPVEGFRGPGEFKENDLHFTRELQSGESVFGEIRGFGDSAKDFDLRVGKQQDARRRARDVRPAAVEADFLVGPYGAFARRVRQREGRTGARGVLEADVRFLRDEIGQAQARPTNS